MAYPHIRHGIGSVRPYIYGDLELPEFLVTVFGGEIIERLQNGSGAHVQMRIGDSMLVIETRDDWLPDHRRSALYVYVTDVDAAHSAAILLGAHSISSPQDKPYAERSCGLRDSFGNTWYVSTFKG
jgi:PhnB protein